MAEADGSARIDLAWGGRMRTFRLGLDQIREYQRVTGYGVGHAATRIAGGVYHADEVIEALRQGLLGAGTAPGEAYALVKAFAEDLEHHPLRGNEYPAMRVLLAAYDPPAGDALEKTMAERAKNKPTQEGDSPSPQSTAQALQ